MASHSLISKISGPVYGLQKLKTLDLSDNIIVSLTPDVFREMPSLLKLYLHGNSLGKCLSIDEKIFQSLQLLEELNLSNNGIQDFPRFIFTPLKNLRSLNLRENHLISVNFELSSLHSLQLRDISSNRIFIMSPENLDFFKLNTIDLLIHKNPFLCTCENRNIIQWIVSVKKNFQFKNLITCKNETSKLINYLEF